MTPRPASASCASRRASTPGRCWRRGVCRSAPDEHVADAHRPPGGRSARELLVDVARRRVSTPSPRARPSGARRPTPRSSAPTSSGSTGRGPPSELERVVRLDRAWTTFRGERLLVLDAVGPAGRRRHDDHRRRPRRPGTLHRTVGRHRRRCARAPRGAAGREAAHAGRRRGGAGCGRSRARRSGARRNAGRLGADAADRPFGAVGRLRQPGRGRGRGGARGRLAARRRHGRPLRPQPDHRPAGGASRCASTRGCSSTATS